MESDGTHRDEHPYCDCDSLDLELQRRIEILLESLSFEKLPIKYYPKVERKLIDDPDYLSEREKLRQAAIDAKNMQILLVLFNYGVAHHYQHLNKCARKR